MSQAEQVEAASPGEGAGSAEVLDRKRDQREEAGGCGNHPGSERQQGGGKGKAEGEGEVLGRPRGLKGEASGLDALLRSEPHSSRCP